jgi:hypothetical protein
MWGYERAENFISPGGAVQDVRRIYAAATPRLNEVYTPAQRVIGANPSANQPNLTA